MKFYVGQTVKHAHSDELLKILKIKGDLVEVQTRSKLTEMPLTGWFPISHLTLLRKDKLDEI